MKIKKIIGDSRFGFWMLCVTLLTFTACQKTEFMPMPEGEKVPYQPDATATVVDLLKSTSEAGLFYQAWQKSTMDERIKALGSNVNYSLLVPNDAAMIEGGYTAAVLNEMSTQDLDSLMLFYTTLGQVRADQLSAQSLPVKSLLIHPKLFVTPFESKNTTLSDPYQYKHYLAVLQDVLFVNGKSKGNLNYKIALDGALFIMDATIEKPTKTTLEILQEDTRFTWFVALMKGLDDSYAEPTIEAYLELFGMELSAEEFWLSYSYLRETYDVLWAVTPNNDPNYVRPNINISTCFAPTNEAFINAGFTSIADVLAFNKEQGDARFDMDVFGPAGAFPMDTIFNYHKNWGRFFAPQDPSFGIAANNATVFFSNDLKQESINTYYVNIGGTAAMQYAYQMPFLFSHAAGKLQMKVKESDQVPVDIVDTDINSLNGPIHVVNNLLLPKGFKLQ